MKLFALVLLAAPFLVAAGAAPPLAPDGHTDLQGIWTNATLTPLERPKGLGSKEFYTAQEFAELARRVRAGDVGQEADLGAAADQRCDTI